VWEKTTQDTFKKLKHQICKEPVLIQPDQKKPFKIKVNASNYAIGAVLVQRDEKIVLHPVTFFSKTMNEAQRNYNVCHWELFRLVKMFRHRRHYLDQAAHKVKVLTDHTSSLFWKNPKDQHRRVVQWHTELMEYDFKLVHISGKKNGWMDALSRCSDYNQCNNDNKKLVVIPPKFIGKGFAWLAGSEEVDPTNQEEWDWLIKDKSKNQKLYQSVQDLVERTNKKMKKAVKSSEIGPIPISWLN
jgi:RNase H-like domain found in reverse transcriptase